MATIFPREEKAEMLFDKILANPEACRRLKRTFYDAIDSGDEFVTENLPAKQFTAALFDAYENKDLTAFLMAVCQNSMFDLLRNAFLHILLADSRTFFLPSLLERCQLLLMSTDTHKNLSIPSSFQLHLLVTHRTSRICCP